MDRAVEVSLIQKSRTEGGSDTMAVLSVQNSNITTPPKAIKQLYLNKSKVRCSLQSFYGNVFFVKFGLKYNTLGFSW